MVPASARQLSAGQVKLPGSVPEEVLPVVVTGRKVMVFCVSLKVAVPEVSRFHGWALAKNDIHHGGCLPGIGGRRYAPGESAARSCQGVACDKCPVT